MLINYAIRTCQAKTGKIIPITKVLLALVADKSTAIFFDAALQGYDVIGRAGLKIPDDISVIGFDDFEFAARAEVPLTTMIHPKYQIGKWAAEILFEQIEHPGPITPQQILLNPTMAVRDSVKWL